MKRTKYVVVDIESSTRTHHGVFAIAVCVSETHSDKVESKLWKFPEQPSLMLGNSTMEFWMSDPDRKKTYDELHTNAMPRFEAAKSIRKYIDAVYEDADEVVFFSDCATFDIGQVDAMLAEHGFLPLFLKTDSAYPAEVVDYTTFVKGLASVSPTGSTSTAFSKLGLVREPRDKGHGPLQDVLSIMFEVESIMEKQKELEEMIED